MKRHWVFLVVMLVFIFTAAQNQSSQVREISKERGDISYVSSKEKKTKNCTAFLSFPLSFFVCSCFPTTPTAPPTIFPSRPELILTFLRDKRERGLQLDWASASEPTKNQFAGRPEGLRHFRDHRWKALGKENSNLPGSIFCDHFWLFWGGCGCQMSGPGSFIAISPERVLVGGR